MPESTCLHIQDRESGPIRVVELPWISVRIGRAAYCEVRLPDTGLAAEACRLTRRGRTWSLTPVGDQNLVVLDGRTVKSPCLLPFGTPFQIGPFCLTLRQDAGADPDWELYPAATTMPSSVPVAPPSQVVQEPDRHEHDRTAEVTSMIPEPAASPSRPVRDRTRWDRAGRRPRRISSPATRESRPESRCRGVKASRRPIA